MTNTDLKTQIDNAITNKITAASITPTDVGNNCKAIVDYADQQDLLLVSLTGSQTISGGKIFLNTPTIPAIDIVAGQPFVAGMRIVNQGDSDGLLVENIEGTGIHVNNSDPSLPGILIDSLLTGNALDINTFDGNGINLICTGTGYGINIDSSSQTGFNLTMGGSADGVNIMNNGASGKAIVITNSNAVNGDVFVYRKNVTPRVVINDLGTITSQGFIKEGASAGQHLMADGTTTVGYKVYTAILNQVGTSNPTAIVLENTTGATITWTRNGLGDYFATASSPVFTVNKTIAMANVNSNGSYTLGSQAFCVMSSTTLVKVNTSTHTSVIDEVLRDTFFEIRIYN